MLGKAQRYILTGTCPVGTGIVAGVTQFLAERSCYISELAHFDDQYSGQLFMRVCFEAQQAGLGLADLQGEFAAVAERFTMQWAIHPAETPTKTLIMVSKFDHCLDDLLFRCHKKELNLDVVAVVSNHLDLRPMVEREGIRFIYLPITPENKAEQEAVLLEKVEELQVDLVVLARYMQILSDKLCQALQGRAINIHHSFLPGFKGAKPYHQAFDRGVKLIGATAHFVTSDLDEGPIIEQAVQPVDHTYSPEQLVTVGRDTETIALSRAVKLFAQHRVFLDSNKTVIFR